MAKYTADRSVIASERRAREFQSMEGAAVAAFAKGFMSTYDAISKEKDAQRKTREAREDQFFNKIGSVDNLQKLEGANKEIVKNWVKSKKDEVANLAAEYERTRDREILEKIDAIKFSFANLNTQLETKLDNQAEYITAAGKRGGLAPDATYNEDGSKRTGSYDSELYSKIHTNSVNLSVGDNGDVSYNIDGKNMLYKDIAGKWDVAQSKTGVDMLKITMESVAQGQANKPFYHDITKAGIKEIFKNSGTEGTQAFAGTDLTGDDEYELPNGKIDPKTGEKQKSGNLSFEAMFGTGVLDEKFYQGFEKNKDNTYDVSWMYDNNNIDKLNDLIAEYYTDVNKARWDQGNANYKPKGTNNGEDIKYQIAKGVYLTEAQIKSNIQDILNASSGTQIPRSDGFGSLEKRGGQWYERTYKELDGEQVPSERRISVDDAITIQGYSGWYNKKDSSEKTFDWAGPYKIIANL